MKLCNKICFSIICIGLLVLCFCFFSIWHKSRYDVENYNCVDMSKDIETCLERVGIPVIIIRGQNDTQGHCWVKIFGIEFDSVTLLPYKNSDLYYIKLKEFESFSEYDFWVLGNS